MRSAIAKEIRRLTSVLVEHRMPGFVLDRDSVTPPGSQLYVWRADAKLWWYFNLMFIENRDQFLLSLLWTTKQRWPHLVVPSLPSPPQEDWSVPLKCFLMPGDTRVINGAWELGRAPTSDPMDYTWLELPPLPESMSKAQEAFREAQDILVKHGFAYIKQVTGLQGVIVTFDGIIG